MAKLKKPNQFLWTAQQVADHCKRHGVKNPLDLNILAKPEPIKKTGRIKRAPKEDRTHDGIVFDSQSEMKVWMMLEGKIKTGCLHRQPKFELQQKFRDVEGRVRQPMRFTADFWLYSEPRTDATATIPPDAFVIDHKGMKTDSFVLREKMFAFRFMHRLHLPNTKKDWGTLLALPEMQQWLR